jgi:hypothetical protein
MTESAIAATDMVEAVLDWKAFLESYPPESTVGVGNVVTTRGMYREASTPPIQLHCESSDCSGVHWFDHLEGDVTLVVKEWRKGILVYRCRHCKRTTKAFALYVFLEEHLKTAKAYKLGEYPPFGPPTPSRVISLVGRDRELLLKGRRAENHGLGIGAFAYYRRVVENEKGRLIEEIGRVARRLGAKPEVLATFEAATNETQFSKAIDVIKDAIPESLLIDGHNPLKLLHTALSKGLHDDMKDDEACLEIAQSIRLVLTELAERISTALKDQAELTDALNRILKNNSEK